MRSRAVGGVGLLGLMGCAHVPRTELDVDLATLSATAVLRRHGRATLDVGDLEIVDIRPADGAVPDGPALRLTGRRRVTVHYRFQARSDAGWLFNGSTLTWPLGCGNLFPCSPNPAVGGRYRLEIGGVAPPDRVVCPARIRFAAPAYAVAWAVGPYTRVDLGQTSAGTRLHVWWLPGGEASALAGTAPLVEAFDWLERTLGPYAFGRDAGSVAVDWEGTGLGGMEHHPLWHVEVGDMGAPLTHVHEAAHGWIGNGVRLRCWEDLVLSEGTASYLAARALGVTDGEAAEALVWAQYQERLERSRRPGEAPVWPSGCGQVDPRHLLSEALYMRGALFLRAAEQQLGRDRLDGVLRDFVRAHLGRAAGMGDLVDALVEAGGPELAALAERWLR